jgi:protocatechuate 3,4-dioxygenase beta subunit
MGPSIEKDHFVTRRQTLGVFGAAGVGVLLGGAKAITSLDGVQDAQAASCTLTPEQEEGPFYVDLEKIRSNVVLGRTGVPLHLRMYVVNSKTCKPLTNAAIDIWHADAAGVYSDESSESTVGSTWLRGVQITNSSGLAKFTSIYPGFYAGRSTHVHVKVHLGGAASSGKYSGGHVSHGGQVFFDEAISTQVYKRTPYSAVKTKRTFHSGDRVYTGQHGSSSIFTLKRVSSASIAKGFIATVVLGVNPSASH